MNRRVACGVFCVSLVAVAAASAANRASAQDAETYYKNLKQLTMIVGNAPGGGYDMTARMVAKFMVKYLPGNANDLVQNMPGAAGIRAANHIYNVAPKDGSTLGLIDRAIPSAPLVYGGESKGLFEATKFSWIGSAMRESGMGAVSTASGVRTIEDAKKKEIFVGGQGPEQDTALYPHVLNALLGTRFKVVYGYNGQDAIQLAVESNELMGMFTSGWSGGGQQFIRSKVNDGTMSTIVYVAPKRDPVHPETPAIIELVNTPEDKRMIELILARMVLGRPFIAPPGIPKDRVDMLRAAFRKAFEDPELKTEAVKRQVAIDPMWGDEAQAAIESIYGAPPEVIARLQKIAAAGRETAK